MINRWLKNTLSSPSQISPKEIVFKVKVFTRMFLFLSKIQKVAKSFLFTCKRRFDFRLTKIIQGWTDHYEAFLEEMHSTCCLLYKNWREVTHRAWDTFPPDMPISLKRNSTLRHYKSHDQLTGSIEIAKAVSNRWRFLKSQPFSLGISSSRYEFQYSVFCLNLHDIWRNALLLESLGRSCSS